MASKALGRFIEKWLEKFKLSNSLTPNHRKKRKGDSFHYLVTQKDAPNMRLENWRDLIYQNIVENPDLHVQLVRYMVSMACH